MTSSFRDVQLGALGELIAIASEDGLRVFLVEMPLSPLTLEEIDRSFSEEDALWR